MTDEVESQGTGPELLLAAAEQLKLAIDVHAAAIAASAPDDVAGVLTAGETLIPSVVAYAEAQAALTGMIWPLGVVRDEEDDEDEDEEDEPDEPVDVVAILQRHDYAVTDADAVMRAGHAAYLRVGPDDNEDDAARRVQDIGQAIYEIAHDDGWGHLERVEGLTPLGGLVFVVRPDEVVDLDGGEGIPHPNQVLPESGEVLFSQSDAWG